VPVPPVKAPREPQQVAAHAAAVPVARARAYARRAAHDKFCSDVLGLRLSDKSRHRAFIHTPHGSDHHLVGSPSPMRRVCITRAGRRQLPRRRPGCRAAYAAAGYAEGWGVGRHVLGSNYFYYVRDPWGS